MDEFTNGLFAGVLATIIVLLVIAMNVEGVSEKVEKGKVFKVNDATYKCEQLNKLDYED